MVSMEARRVLPVLAVVAMLAVVLAVGAGVSRGVFDVSDARPDVVSEGDKVAVHLRAYDAQARLLFSTSAADKPALETVAEGFGGPFVVPPLEKDTPSEADATRLSAPVKLDNTSSFVLGEQLIGKRLGDRFAVPVLGSFEGYTQTVRLERHRGPFPATLTASEGAIDALVQPAADGTLRLDDLLPVRILSREGGNATIALDVADGDELTVRQAGFTATTLREDGSDEFRLRLGAEAGDTFTLSKPCKFARYVLPVGSYRIDAVTDDEIVLARAVTRWPQLIDRPIVIVLEIAEILDKE